MIRFLVVGMSVLFALYANAQAKIPISGLPSASALTGANLIPAVQGGTTVHTTPNTIFTFVSDQLSATPPLILSSSTMGQLLTIAPEGASLVQTFGGGLLVSSNAKSNGIVGTVVQDGSNGNSFPTAVTAYANVDSAGLPAFAYFSQCDLRTAGDCSNEVDINNVDAAPPSTFPPIKAFGTTQIIGIGTAYVSIGTFNAYAVTTTGGGSRKFIVDHYVYTSGAGTYGTIYDTTTTNDTVYL